MRILIINNLYGRRAKGGAERIVQLEAEGLAEAGHEVLVLSLGYGAAPEGDLGVPGEASHVSGRAVGHVELRVPNIYPYADGVRHGAAAKFLWHLVDAFNLAGALSVRRAVRSFRPDVVHTHNLMGFGFLVPRALRRLGVRHVHTVHDVQLVNPSGLIPAGGSGPLMGVLEFLNSAVVSGLFGSPGTVTFPSVFMRELHCSRGFFRKSHFETVPNPAPPVAPAQRFMPEDPLFLFVGQLEEHKGVRLLLDAWRNAALAGATLEIAGSGTLSVAIDNDAGVVFRSRLSRRELTEAYGRASFVVIPSLVLENSPTVILEAFAAGTPVIAVNQGGIPELVRDGENGLLSGIGRDALVSALREAAAVSPDAWSAMSSAAKDAAGERTVEGHLSRLMEIYRC
jgi:glycosyltransferase involved in cell wall biosynthesis